MSFFTEVAILFQGMSWIVWLLLLLGYVFIVIELFQPGFGIFGVVGGALVALAIVLRVSVGDGNLYAQIFIILFMMSVLTLIAFLVLAMTAKKGWVRRSPLVESATNVNASNVAGVKDVMVEEEINPEEKVEVDATEN